MEQPVETTNDPSLVLGSSNSRIQVTVPNLSKVTSKFADLSRLTHLGLDGMWVYGLKAQGEGNDLDMNMLDRLKCEGSGCIFRCCIISIESHELLVWVVIQLSKASTYPGTSSLAGKTWRISYEHYRCSRA
jgi:hypothetical protein